MAYATSNPPIKLTLGPLTNFGATGGNGGDVWLYRSTDAIATVQAANYFTNGQALGMQAGDMVVVLNTSIPKISLAIVASVTSSGASLGTTSVASLQ